MDITYREWVKVPLGIEVSRNLKIQMCEGLPAESSKLLNPLLNMGIVRVLCISFHED
jgi:hypothetical protein